VQRDLIQKVYGMPVLAYGVLLVVIAALLLPAWLLLVQLLTFHVALMQRSMTTYEFIVSQRQKEKALSSTRAVTNQQPTARQLFRRWITNNAPCLAVCDLCEEIPAAASNDIHRPAKQTTLCKQRGLPCSRSTANLSRQPRSTHAEEMPDASDARGRENDMKHV
jgi:hypothetical protein